MYNVLYSVYQGPSYIVAFGQALPASSHQYKNVEINNKHIETFINQLLANDDIHFISFQKRPYKQNKRRYVKHAHNMVNTNWQNEL